MTSIRTSTTSGLALALAGLVIAGLIYSVTQGASATAPPERSGQATAVEAEIARTGLTNRLEVALGDDFGGVWFEPSTAQVKVGVTSPASRRSVEAVAAQAGLAAAVEEVRVQSTWVQLIAAQKRWSHRLDDLFDRGEVATSISADHNSLEVELGTEVSSARRAALELEADAESVAVSIVTSPYPQLRVIPQARCKEFKEKEAFCDPTIVAGVTQYSAVVMGKEAGCTVGPAVILKDRSKPEDATKTFILTAGHCINGEKNGGGVGNKWYAYNKEGFEAGKHEIGEAVAFLDNETDIGLIEVKSTSYWRKAADPIPVVPTVARWSKVEETEPFPVIKQITPMENTNSCMSGQASAIRCGTITKVNQEATISGVKKTNLVEVKEPVTEKGDSGAPWFAESQYKEAAPMGFMEGTHVGRVVATGNPVFQPLAVTLLKLKELEKGFDLELLTKSNERRHPVVTADKYPVTVSAKDATSSDQFTAFGGTVTCAESEFDGELTEEEDSLEVTPLYKECTADAGTLAKVTSNECKYKFTLKERVAEGHYKVEAGVACPEGKPGIQIHIYSNHSDLTTESEQCTLTVPPQSGLKSVTATNSAGKIVIDSGTVEGMKVQVDVENCLCLYTPGTETTAGVYHIEEPLTFSGSSGEEEVAIDLAGG